MVDQALVKLEQGIEEVPLAIINRAQEQARQLMAVVDAQRLYEIIEGKKYLRVEGWEIILAFNGVHAETEYVKEIIKDGEIIGYEAKVNLLRRGVIVGSAIMTCGLDEFPCRGKEGQAKHKAAISAAQTWALSKAARLNFSWVAVLAGYQPTPAEEMLRENEEVFLDSNKEYLTICPKHKKKWFRDKFSKLCHKEGNEWCNFSKIMGPIIAEAALNIGYDKEKLAEFIKEQFDKTWSKLDEKQISDLLNMLNLQAVNESPEG